MKKLSQKEIAKMPIKDLSIDQFIKLAKRVEPGVKLSLKKILSLQHGAFLGVHRSKKGKWYRLHLKKIWIKYYDKRYSLNVGKGKKQYIGKEMIISGMPLPKGPVLIK